MAQAHAFLGNRDVSHTFKFNPDSANWAYQENVSTQDTIGGRVIQLLSVQVSGVSVQGRAGSRKELQRLASNIKEIMKFHIKTSTPVQFRVPSRNWNFLVYVQAMPQMGWDVAATSYPYQLQLAVEEDLSGIKTYQLQNKALKRLADGIGYNPSVHGGGIGNFQALVDSVLKLAPDAAATGGAGSTGAWNPNAKANGLNTGSISGQDTPSLQEIEQALKAKGMLRPGRTCGSDTVPGATVSEHYYCNAKDLMVSSGTATGKQKEDGDAIANFLEFHLRNNTLPINTIIWYRRSLSRSSLSSGWQSYSGVSDHTDHVHVSGYPSLGGGG